MQLNSLLPRMMRKGGLEPPRIAPLDPKSSNSHQQFTEALGGKQRKEIQNGSKPSISATNSATSNNGKAVGTARGPCESDRADTPPCMGLEPTVLSAPPDLYADSKIFLAWRFVA